MATTVESKPAAGSKSILYVDDEVSLLFMVKRLLERRGHRVTTVDDGESAVRAITANPTAFDLLLVDYNMPGMTGIEVATRVRSIAPDLPIAIASGFITDELLEQAHRLGVHEVIFKPNAVKEYTEVVERFATQ